MSGTWVDVSGRLQAQVWPEQLNEKLSEIKKCKVGLTIHLSDRLFA